MSDGEENETEIGGSMSTEESLASISHGIDSLESFLDELTHSLVTQNQEMETMNPERETYLSNLRNTPDPSTPRLNSFFMTHPIPPQTTTDPRVSVRPSRLQMGREWGPRVHNEGEANRFQSSTFHQASQNMVESDARLLAQRLRHAQELREYQPGFQLDVNVQFGGDGNPTLLQPQSQNLTSLLDAIRRATEAAISAGDAAGREHFEQMQQDLANNSSIPHPEPIESSTSSSSEEGGDESDFLEWDRSTVRDMLSNYFQTESDSEEEHLVFFGVINSPAEETPAAPPQRASTRRQANRNVSPATLRFFQNIGIRIEEGDEAALKNEFGDFVIMPCPKTYIPEECDLGSDTPEEFKYGASSTTEEVKSENDVSEKEEKDPPQAPLVSKPEESKEPLPSGPSQASLSSSLPQVDLDTEDLELERLIQEFRRKKLESKAAGDNKVESGSEEKAEILEFSNPTPSFPMDGQGPGNSEPNKAPKSMRGRKGPPKSAPGGRQNKQENGHAEVKVHRLKMTTCLTTTSTIKKKTPKKN